MRMMFLFCLARVAVAVAGLAVMAYVALGCTWAAIEETAPIAQSDDGACLRVKYPLIEPGACLVGIAEEGTAKFSANGWRTTTITIPTPPVAAEWWLVAPAGAGYTVVSTDNLRELDAQSEGDDPASLFDLAERIRVAIYIPGPGTQTVLLGRDSDYKLLMYSAQDSDVTVQRLVTAPTPE